MFCKRLSLRFAVPAFLSKLLYSHWLFTFLHIEDTCCLNVRSLSIVTPKCSVRASVAIERLLTIASTSIMRVLRDSSSNWLAWFWSKPVSTLLAVRICLSHTPPMWLECGAFIFQENQSQPLLRSSLRILSWFISQRAASNSFFAPAKLVPWFDLSCWAGPQWRANRRYAFKNESVVNEDAVSRWMAREAMQVKSTPYRFISFRPSLM